MVDQENPSWDVQLRNTVSDLQQTIADLQRLVRWVIPLLAILLAATIVESAVQAHATRSLIRSVDAVTVNVEKIDKQIIELVQSVAVVTGKLDASVEQLGKGVEQLGKGINKLDATLDNLLFSPIMRPSILSAPLQLNHRIEEAPGFTFNYPCEKIIKPSDVLDTNAHLDFDAPEELMYLIKKVVVETSDDGQSCQIRLMTTKENAPKLEAFLQRQGATIPVMVRFTLTGSGN